MSSKWINLEYKYRDYRIHYPSAEKLTTPLPSENTKVICKTRRGKYLFGKISKVKDEWERERWGELKISGIPEMRFGSIIKILPCDGILEEE